MPSASTKRKPVTRAEPDLAWCITCEGVTSVVVGGQRFDMRNEAKAVALVGAINALVRAAAALQPRMTHAFS